MRSILIFLTALSLVIFCFFCLTKRTDIQQDVKTNVTNSLSNSQMDWAKVSIDGRDITLTGIADNKEIRYQAGKVALNSLGVRTVNNQITLADIATPSPYIFNVQYNGQVLRLSGYVDNIDIRGVIVKEARKKFGAANIIDNLRVAKGSPNDWSKTISHNIYDKLPIFSSAVFRLSDKNLLVHGTLIKGEDVKNTESNLLKTMNEGYNLTTKIKAYNDEITAIKSANPITKQKAKTCQIAFNTALAKDNIYFNSDSSKIDSQSIEVLEQLVRITKNCPSAKIEIAGHTDSQGNDLINLKLSEERAKSVVTFLTKSGVNKARLTATGYGETKPIASNKSSKGRAKNRRIEFIIKE